MLDVDRLLQDLEEHRREREGSSITTAFNLMAFVEDDEQLARAIDERIDQIAARNPLRTILFTAADRAPEVSMERVKLSVRDLAAPQLQSVAHELLLPNVHTVLLWAGAHVTDPRFASLGNVADVIVTFTSRTAHSETQTLADMVAMQTTPLGPKLRDLAFLRLNAWQELVAQFFDDDDLMPELDRLRTIGVSSGTKTEAYYFIGWLASRLAWQPCGMHQFCNAAGETIGVELRADGPPRRLKSVTLESENATFDASISSDTDDVVCLNVTGKHRRAQRCIPLNDMDMVSLVERAIFTTDNSVYDETLAMVGRLLQHLT